VGSTLRFTKALVGNKRALRKIADLKAELEAHNIIVADRKKGALTDEMAVLIALMAYFLKVTADAVAGEGDGVDTGELNPPPNPVLRPPSRKRKAPDSPGHPTHGPPISPQVAKREFRDDWRMRKDEKAEDAEELPTPPGWREDIADEPYMAPVYGLAFRAIIAKVLRYDDYKTFMVARDVKRILTNAEWNNVTIHAFVLAQQLLDSYLFDGAKVAEVAYKEFKEGGNIDWRKYWPHAHEASIRRALSVDTTWCVQGYTSPHGITHIQDTATQLILAVCHLTKHGDPHKAPPPPPRDSRLPPLATSPTRVLRPCAQPVGRVR
jgi:hypothetical protein